MTYPNLSDPSIMDAAGRADRLARESRRLDVAISHAETGTSVVVVTRDPARALRSRGWGRWPEVTVRSSSGCERVLWPSGGLLRFLPSDFRGISGDLFVEYDAPIDPDTLDFLHAHGSITLLESDHVAVDYFDERCNLASPHRSHVVNRGTLDDPRFAACRGVTSHVGGKVKVRLNPQHLAHLLDLPDGARVVGLSAHADPLQVDVIVESVDFPDQWMGEEAPHAPAAQVTESDRLAWRWPTTRQDDQT